MGAESVTEIEQAVRALVCEELKLPPAEVTPATQLRELPGIESIKVLRIIAKVERKFDIELEDEVVFKVTTTADLAAAIARLLAAGAPGGRP